jgi:hypothetical protein
MRSVAMRSVAMRSVAMPSRAAHRKGFSLLRAPRESFALTAALPPKLSVAWTILSGL